MATGSSGKGSQVIVLQLLTPGVPAAWPEVEDMAPVTDPGPIGRQRWPVAVDGGHGWLTSPLVPNRYGGTSFLSRRCSGGWCHWKGPLRGGPQLCRPLATAAVIGACHPAQGLRECGAAAPLRSGESCFFAAAGGCGIGFWIARRLARGCGGRRRLWDRGGGRWLAEAPRRS